MTDQRPPSQQAREAGFEISDARPWPIFFTGLGLAALIALSMIILRLIGSPPHTRPGAILPSFEAARDSVAAWTQTKELLEQRQQLSKYRLSSYRWLDADHSAAAIPIEQAMRILADRHRNRPATSPPEESP